MSKDIEKFQSLIKWANLEPWKKELAEFVIKAELDGKHIECKYQNLTFTPRALARQLCKGHFIWGIVNWVVINPIKKPDYSDSQD